MNFRSNLKVFFALVFSIVVGAGCTGQQTFHDHARAGDTIAVAAGWAHHLDRGNFEVKITDNNGTETTYAPGTPAYDAVKASVRFYPDPVSSLVVSERVGTNLTPGALDYSMLINDVVTSGDRDWWETVIFVDLPDPMALGDATVEITELGLPPSETVTSIVTIVPNETGVGTGGMPNAFGAETGGFSFNMVDTHFQSLERVAHYEVSFTGSTVPHAIQVELNHDPDEAHAGVGTPYVVNPVGHVKSIHWSQTGVDGTDLRVIIMPSAAGGANNMHDFKFYVAGGVTGLAVNGAVQAFDVNGAPVSGVSASIAGF